MTTQDWTNLSVLFLIISNGINYVLICQLQRRVAELEKKAQP